MDLISKATRIAFREHLVGWTLATIRDLFDAEDVLYCEVEPTLLPAGQRRGLVEQYYAGVDWEDAREVRKILRVYECILQMAAESTMLESPSAVGEGKTMRILLNHLRRDGFVFENGRLESKSLTALPEVSSASKLINTSVIVEHIRRINPAIEADPDLAIGSAKELVETVAKHILEENGAGYDASASFQQLVKRALESLNLSVEAIPEASKGATALKQVLSGLNQVVGATAELRNLYGTGHGRTRSGGLRPRHAKLVVGAAATLSVFLLETFDDRRKAVGRGVPRLV